MLSKRISAHFPNSVSLNNKYSETFDGRLKSYFKRELNNGLISIFKNITGNLDSSDGEYYSN